jgi:AcrR family transcriptional regulator
MKKTRRREIPSIRREEILSAAIDLAIRIGYQNITRDAVANAANTSCALVTTYFPMVELKNAVMKMAIEKEILPIIAQGLSLGDTQAQGITPELKQRVLEFLSN